MKWLKYPENVPKERKTYLTWLGKESDIDWVRNSAKLILGSVWTGTDWVPFWTGKGLEQQFSRCITHFMEIVPPEEEEVR